MHQGSCRDECIALTAHIGYMQSGAALCHDGVYWQRAPETLTNGSPLPGWLSFDPQSRVFTVTTVAPGALPLQVLVKIGDKQWTCYVTERK
jgi:hypothetical protein